MCNYFMNTTSKPGVEQRERGDVAIEPSFLTVKSKLLLQIKIKPASDKSTSRTATDTNQLPPFSPSLLDFLIYAQQ